MTPPPPHPDIVTVAIAVATALFGPQMGEIAGPYGVILLGACLGGAWATTRRPESGAVSSLLYMAGVVGIALLVTVPLSELVASHWGLESRWTLGPVAAIVGGIGHDWPKVGAWALSLAKQVVESTIGRRKTAANEADHDVR